MRHSSDPLLPTMAKPNGAASNAPKKKKVLIVGAGAAGMIISHTLVIIIDIGDRNVMRPPSG